MWGPVSVINGTARFQKGKGALQVSSRWWKYLPCSDVLYKAAWRLVLLCCCCISLEMMPFYAGQGLGIAFPAVMDLLVQIFDLAPNHMHLSARCWAQWVVSSHVREREKDSGEQSQDCSIIVPGLHRLVRGSDPWLRDGGQYFTCAPCPWKPLSDMNYSICLEQYCSPIDLRISAIFSVGREKRCLLCIWCR